MKTIKIFISSPGDVVHERQIAKRVIAKLGKEFASSVKLEALLWEDMPLQVNMSFQEGIDQIINTNMVDIAVFILWSRLGSPPGNRFTKPDGSLYKSGTEYEFEMMYAANQQSGGTPAILAYIKNASITNVLTQLSENIDFEEIGKQHKETQRFIQEKFYDPETKTIYGAYHQFDVPTTFEQKLTEHLRRLIIEIGYEPVPIEWEGNPYVGLRSFTYEENAIFCGRRHAINKIEQLLIPVLRKKAPSLFILGESGAGKSSLVRAGLLPDIIEFKWIEMTKWKWFDIMPGQFHGNVYQGIASKFMEAFPDLGNTAMGRDLIEGKTINYHHLADIMPSKEANESVLFFIDQFEEIFTDPLITESERNRFFTLLKGMASTHKVWLIFSMRNDFYHKFTSYPVLHELKNESIVYDIPKALHSELQEIVEEPAKKAGLKWEINESGLALNKTIIHDINAGVDDLPLIEFALSELYDLRNENNQLTFEAYNSIGRINGAIIRYVNNFYNSLTEEERVIFYQLLSALITPSAESKNLYVRKTVLRKDMEKSSEHKFLITKLIDKHILVSGKDGKEEATISIVHEIVIKQWQVIQDWIKQEKYFIDANNYYENLSQYWTEHNKSKNDLLQEKEAIKESEYFLHFWKDCASEKVKEFLYASIKKNNRKFLPLVCFMLFSDVLLFLSFAIAVIFRDDPDDIMSDFGISSIIKYVMFTILLIYVAWKKIKNSPRFNTINISLTIWSILFITSIIDFTISMDAKVNIISLILPICIFLKLTSVFIEKKEMQQWSKRSFKRSSKISSAFSKISSALQKVIKPVGVVFVASSFLAGITGLGIVLKEKEKKLKNSQKKLENSYAVLDKLSDYIENENVFPLLHPADRMNINREWLNFLQENFPEERNDTITNKRDSQYALCQYYLGRPDRVWGNISFEAQHDSVLYINTAFELGLYDKCREMIELYKNAIENAHGNLLASMIWSAEKVGAFELAKNICLHLGDVGNNGTLVINKAHSLLMTGEKEKALFLYRKDTSFHWKYEIERDFSIFRWLGFSDNEISDVEKELNLNKIKVYTHPEDEKNINLAKPFIGEWQCEENGFLINWEITEDKYNLCFYVIQTKNTPADQWHDYDVAVARYRMKQMDDKTILEEYDSRKNVLAVGEIKKINDNELHVKIIENGVPEMRGKVKIYHRITED
jgi:hypothetical protein